MKEGKKVFKKMDFKDGEAKRKREIYFFVNKKNFCDYYLNTEK